MRGPSPSTVSLVMRVRSIASFVGLALAAGVHPLAAHAGPVPFQRDGTYFHSIYAEALARQQPGRAESDSTDGTPVFLIAGGAVAGLAAYFVSTSGGGDPLPGGRNPGSTDGILLPPQEGFDLPIGDPRGSLPNGVLPPLRGFEGPVTVTPEPVSMVLLASGLAGIGGASLRRRMRRP